MNLQQLQAKSLKEKREIEISHNFHYITIFENSEGDWEGNVYDGESYIFDTESEPLDGGICETEDELTAIEFFTEISINLTNQGL